MIVFYVVLSDDEVGADGEEEKKSDFVDAQQTIHFR